MEGDTMGNTQDVLGQFISQHPVYSVIIFLAVILLMLAGIISTIISGNKTCEQGDSNGKLNDASVNSDADGKQISAQ